MSLSVFQDLDLPLKQSAVTDTENKSDDSELIMHQCRTLQSIQEAVVGGFRRKSKMAKVLFVSLYNMGQILNKCPTDRIGYMLDQTYVQSTPA